MARQRKLLLVYLALALLLTAACRFIYHTEREYAQWIMVYRDISAHLDAQCAQRKRSEVCSSARERRAFLDSLESYRGAVAAWWWPAVAGAAAAWIATAATLIVMARARFGRPR